MAKKSYLDDQGAGDHNRVVLVLQNVSWKRMRLLELHQEGGHEGLRIS